MIDAIACYKFLAKAKRAWLLNPDNPVKYAKGKFYTFVCYRHIEKDLCDFMVSHLQERYERMLRTNKLTLEKIQENIDNQVIENVYERMMDIFDVWVIVYNGAVENLAKISSDSQSIHTVTVTRKTNEGIGILEGQAIPEGQKTLAEIKAEWLLLPHASQLPRAEKLLEQVMDDMKDWARRPFVMNQSRNIYKAVLRGLWAKIKTFDSVLKAELTKRLWEECLEAKGMCADGHVGRLVNVLTGFDEQFKNDISPKEYFQNNIALISNSDAPLEFKITQVKRLMDEIQMADNERDDWLSAL